MSRDSQELTGKGPNQLLTVFENSPALSRELEARVPAFSRSLGSSVVLQSLLFLFLY